MRLISQDGMIDVPYEHGSLCIGFIKGEEHLIYTISYYNYSSQRGTKLAEYSSKVKALKVMEMLRDEYLYCERCRTIGEEAGMIPSYMLKFPDDEEVEV